MIASFQTAFENVEQSTNFLAPSIALFLGVLVLFHFFSFFSLKNHRVIAEDDQWSVFLGSPTLNGKTLTLIDLKHSNLIFLDALAWTLLGLSVAVAFCSISSVIIILIGLYLICVIQPQLAGTIAAKSNCVMLIDLLSIAIWFLCMSVLINGKNCVFLFAGIFTNLLFTQN